MMGKKKMAGGGMAAKKKMAKGGIAKKRGGGMMKKKDPLAMAMGGNVSPRKAIAMGMKKGGKVMKGKKKKVMSEKPHFIFSIFRVGSKKETIKNINENKVSG